MSARNYGGLSTYKQDFRSRNQGAIHTLVTIDTPASGSSLAGYLLSIGPRMYNPDSYASLTTLNVGQVLWNKVCDYRWTLQRCLGVLNMPLVSSAIDPATGLPYALDKGAVDSLRPERVLGNAAPTVPPNATWVAISNQFLDSAKDASILRAVLQDLAANVYPLDAHEAPPTFTSVLGGNNDVIVAVPSQQAGKSQANLVIGPNGFGNLEHCATPEVGRVAPILGLSDANALNSDLVNAAVLKALQQGNPLGN